MMRRAAILVALGAAPFLRAQEPAGGAGDIVQQVRAMSGSVSAGSLERAVRTLAGFETRHTLSDPDPAGRGIGAARAWIEREMREIATASGGRMTVELQSAKVACARPGMPREVEVTNVIATLRGTEDPDRVYVVSGHHDSRNATGADAKGLAPGANDDGSGTAVMLEACRAMARSSFPATIVFAAYDGEEHGLLGSQAHAEALAAAGLTEAVARAQAMAAWPMAVGARIAAVTEPRRLLEDGTLVVGVRTHAWMTELSLMEPQLLARLASAAVTHPVRRLRWELLR